MSNNVNHSAILRQRNRFLQVVEELRCSRKTNKVLEDKISLLLEEKVKLQASVETVTSKYLKSEDLREEWQEIVRRLKNSSKEDEVGDENKKLKVALEASELTIASLKKTIASYTSSTNLLERKLAECEKRLSVNEKTSQLFCNQMEQIHSAVDRINSYIQQTKDAQVRIEKNVGAVTSINKEFSVVQDVHKSIISELKKEKQSLAREVVKLQSELGLKESFISTSRDGGMQELKQQIEEMQRDYARLKEQLMRRNEELIKSRKIAESAENRSMIAHKMLLQSTDQHEIIVKEMQDKLEAASALNSGALLPSNKKCDECKMTTSSTEETSEESSKRFRKEVPHPDIESIS